MSLRCLMLALCLSSLLWLADWVLFGWPGVAVLPVLALAALAISDAARAVPGGER